MLDRVELHECDYNWKTFIEVYLEDYHVGPFHPGLGSFVTCDDLRWEFGAELLGADGGRGQPRWPSRARPVYQQVARRSCCSYRDGKPPKHGAIWLTYYPHVMVEWYPHVLMVSTLLPQGAAARRSTWSSSSTPRRSSPSSASSSRPQQAAYMETCVEDDEIAAAHGRRPRRP